MDSIVIPYAYFVSLRKGNMLQRKAETKIRKASSRKIHEEVKASNSKISLCVALFSMLGGI
jgi:hypothetical protein